MLDDIKNKQLIEFRDCFVEYPAIKEIYSVFDELMEDQILGAEQSCMLITGNTGAGKSALINNFVKRFEASNGLLGEMPVLSTRIPEDANQTNTLELMLQHLKSTISTKASTRRTIPLTERVIKALKIKKVRLVIINEIQELLQFKSIQQRQKITDMFKRLCEESQVPFVFVGMPYSEMLLEEDQLRSRIYWRREIGYFSLYDAVKVDGKKSYELSEIKQEHFAAFVGGLANRMGFEEPPELKEKEILIPLFALCKGEMRSLKKFLNQALKMALKENKTTIDKAFLSKTFKHIFPSETNPFEMPVEELEIQQIEKSASYNLNASIEEDKLHPLELTDFLPIGQLLSKKTTKV